MRGPQKSSASRSRKRPMTDKANFELLRFAFTLAQGTKLAGNLIKQILFGAGEAPGALEDLENILRECGMAVPSASLAPYWYGFEKLAVEAEQAHVEMLHLTDTRYPATLRAIYDPPPILYVKGSLGILETLPGIAIVGTREATSNGRRIAYRLAAFMAENKWTVVSGLALGIDAAAHEGALARNAPNIAVLAHGLHTASPPSHKVLAQSILDAGGAWVSEHPMGQTPRKEFFVRRNRIQIGLSVGSIIVEGKVRSGTMTQAQFCLRERRPLFAVVPSDKINSLGLVAEGTRWLVQERKAIPIYGKEDYSLLLETARKARDSLPA
jgi:DNA processing protein